MFKSLHCWSPWLQVIFREFLIVTLLGMTRTWKTDSKTQTRVGLVGAAAAKKTIDCYLPACLANSSNKYGNNNNNNGEQPTAAVLLPLY